MDKVLEVTTAVADFELVRSQEVFQTLAQLSSILATWVRSLQRVLILVILIHVEQITWMDKHVLVAQHRYTRTCRSIRSDEAIMKIVHRVGAADPVEGQIPEQVKAREERLRAGFCAVLDLQIDVLMAPRQPIRRAQRHGVSQLANAIAVVAMRMECVDGVHIGTGVSAYRDELVERRDDAQR